MASIQQSFKNQKEYLKGKTPKEKLQFFWEFYKWHALIWTIGIVCLFVFVYNKLTAPVYVLYGIMLNTENEASDSGAEDLANAYMEAYSIDTSKGTVYFSDDFSYIPGDKDNAKNNYETSQEILAQSEEENLDFVAGPLTSMQDLAYNGIFIDLRQYLNKEQIEKYQDYFLYADSAVITELAEAYENDEDVSSIEIPDCTNPDAMEEPIPIMINITQCEKLKDIYDGEEETLMLGIITNSPHQTKLLNFLAFIME